MGQTGLPEVGEGGRKTSLVAPREDRVTALVGEINSEPCFLSLLSVTPLTKATGSGDSLSGVFRCGRNTLILELNQNKMAAGGFLCEDAHDGSCSLFSIHLNLCSNGTPLHWSHDFTAMFRAWMDALCTHCSLRVGLEPHPAFTGPEVGLFQNKNN